MSFSKAIQFVKAFTSDQRFRQECDHMEKDKLERIFEFNEFELDDAINTRLVKCQSFEEAEKYHHLRMYYQIIKANEISTIRKT